MPHSDLRSSDSDDEPAPSVTGLLRELASLAGQAPAGDVPELELQIGDILSRATVRVNDGVEYLVVTVTIPVSRQSPSLAGGRIPPELGSIHWRKEGESYVGTRHLPVRSLANERDILDAILATADDAIGWHDMLTKLDLQQQPRDERSAVHKSSAP